MSTSFVGLASKMVRFSHRTQGREVIRSLVPPLGGAGSFLLPVSREPAGPMFNVLRSNVCAQANVAES